MTKALGGIGCDLIFNFIFHTPNSPYQPEATSDHEIPTLKATVEGRIFKDIAIGAPFFVIHEFTRGFCHHCQWTIDSFIHSFVHLLTFTA